MLRFFQIWPTGQLAPIQLTGVFAAGWGVELDAAGLLEDLDPYIAADSKIDLDDIAPISANLAKKLAERQNF